MKEKFILNRKKAYIRKKIIFKKDNINFYYIIIFIISSIILSSNSTIDENDLDESKYSYITLTIGKGENYVYSKSYDFDTPEIVYINENKKELVNKSYTFEETENSVILIWEKPIKNCEGMFESCDKIIEINLTHFDTSQVTNMHHMFYDCNNLKYLDISNLDTSKVENMGAMFYNCSSLESIDLSNFNTSNNRNIGTMFMGCSSLKSINLSNFDTSKTKYFDNLFNGCSNLTSISLANFNTSNAIYMENMFQDCTSLITIEFQNLDLSTAEKTDNMFKNCENLLYINFKNLKPKNNILKYNFFNDCPKNITICLENNELIDKIKTDDCNTFDCSDNWYQLRKKIYENDKCTDNCYLTEYKYEYNFKCYSTCFNGTYNNNYICENCHEDCRTCDGPYTKNNSNCLSCLSENKYLYLGNCIDICPKNYSYYNETISQNICDCELIQCKTCSIESLNKNLCISCDTEEGYYPIYDDLYINNLTFYNCYKSIEGYYYDNETSTFKLCYNSCKNCNKEGDEINNNCLECKSNYVFEIHFDGYKNCYDNCSYYHYFDENENISFCTNNSLCPINFNKLIEDKRKCISSCEKDNTYKYEFKSKCYIDCPPNSSKRENDDDLSYLNLNKNYFCKPICNKENPFEIIYSQLCVENCDYKEIQNKSCILNYNNYEDSKLDEIYDNLLKNVEDEFTSNDYNTTNLKNGNDDIIE